MNPAKPNELSPTEIQRYQRHLCLSNFGLAAQQRLKGAGVLIVGIGGLGCPAAIYLAAAGVGTIGLVDFDTVDAGNLQRQILFGDGDVGCSKVDVAAEALKRLNKTVTVKVHNTAFSPENAAELVTAYDVLIDASDNFATRYLVNDACVLYNTPCCYGSVLQFRGQLSVFAAAGGPCYRCLYPTMPAADQIPDCAEAGVLGVLPGVIGSMQATEAIKLLTGIGTPLVGRVWLYDALAMTTRELQLAPDPACPVCGRHPTITTLQTETPTCNTPPAVIDLSCEELHQLLKNGPPPLLLDVRHAFEYAAGHLAKAKLIPLPELPTRSPEIPPDQTVVVYCEHGQRSRQAADILLAADCRDVRNLTGGLHQWRRQGLPLEHD